MFININFFDINKIMSIYKKLLSIEFQLNLTKNYRMKVTLKHDEIKGIGLFSTQKIKKDEMIAYYKLKVFDERKYESPTNNMYTFAVFTKIGAISKNLIADIVTETFQTPKKNIPYWGCFVNEPSSEQRINSVFDPNISENNKNCEKKRIHPGDYVIYLIRALRDIEIEEEITTYYGDEYERNYEINISEEDKKKCVF